MREADNADSEPLLTLQVHRDGDEYVIGMQTPLVGSQLAHCLEDVAQALHQGAISVVAQGN